MKNIILIFIICFCNHSLKAQTETYPKGVYMNFQEVMSKNPSKNYNVELEKRSQGMVIFVPESSELDHTRPKAFYDETYEYLKEIGIQEIE